jgi:uncharacterized protein YpmB
MTNIFIILTAIIILLVCISIIYYQRKKIRQFTQGHKEMERLTDVQDALNDVADATEGYKKVISMAGARFIDENDIDVWVKKERIGPYIQLKLYDMYHYPHASA